MWTNKNNLVPSHCHTSTSSVLSHTLHSDTCNLGSAPGTHQPPTPLLSSHANPFLKHLRQGGATASCLHPCGGSSCRAPSRLPLSSQGSEGVQAAGATSSHRGQAAPWVSFFPFANPSAPLFCFSWLTWARGHFLVVLSSSWRSAFTPNGHSEMTQEGELRCMLGTALNDCSQN